MSHPLNLTLEMMFQRLEAQGEFDHLAGAGQPIGNLSEPAPSVLDRIMAEADVKPVPVLLKIEIAAIRQRLAAERDPGARKDILRELADMQTRLAVEIEAYNRFG
ncbi:DUF1992 domain-containing protein [Tropicimonas marinistellae]|uniref:DUF1992 domain-containing protein n=1 Tax=Tropicimonas marinistellae TaxID=1739787 RepID=UPI00082B8DE0|nr:DUF1992 domain-containing protein [Tropicimonas marinistellae]